MQAQITTLVDGVVQSMGAGVSCGFADGLGGNRAGYCIFLKNELGSTTTWSTAM